MKLVVEELSVLAIKLEVVLSPGRIASLNDKMSFAVRSWARDLAFAGSEPEGAHVIDAVLMTALYDSETKASRTLNMSYAANKLGNLYNSTADYLLVLGWRAPSLKTQVPPAAAAAGKRRLGSQEADQSPPALSRRLQQKSAAAGKGEGLALTLDSTFSSVMSQTSIGGASIVCLLNILVGSPEEAANVKSIFETAGPLELGRLSDALSQAFVPSGRSLATGNSTNSTMLATPPGASVGSVSIVELSLQRSFFGVFLEWLRENVLRVIIGSSFIIAFSLFLVLYRKYADDVKDRLREKAAAKAVAQRDALIKRIRLRSTKSKIRKALRRSAAFVSLLHRLREQSELRKRGDALMNMKDSPLGAEARSPEERFDSIDFAAVTASVDSRISGGFPGSIAHAAGERLSPVAGNVDSLDSFSVEFARSDAPNAGMPTADKPKVGASRALSVFTRAAQMTTTVIRMRPNPREKLVGLKERIQAAAAALHVDSQPASPQSISGSTATSSPINVEN